MAKQNGSRLEAYFRKRDFSKTPEPHKDDPPPERQLVVQQHHARRLHYDLRLEIGGVLVSWAVTKGPSANPKTKRLAVRTEDHPLAYGSFEGTIPKGQYGGGTVLLWESTTYVPLNGDPAEALARGEIKFESRGARLQGRWVLVRMNKQEARENWLLIKERDAFAEQDDGLAQRFLTSVASGRDKPAIESGAAGAQPRPKAGKPVAVPEFVPPQLCSESKQIPDGDNWAFELKYDGYRLIIGVANGEARLYTRSGLDWTNRFPAIAKAASSLPCQSALLDGEAVVLDAKGFSDFPALVAKLERGKTSDVLCIAFDLIQLDGEDLRNDRYDKRKELLKRLLKPDPILRYGDYVRGSGEDMFATIAAAGGEGLIAKDIRSVYRSGRNSSWLKIKTDNRADVIVLGFMPAKEGGSFASLLAGIKTDLGLSYAGRIGTGYSQTKRRQLAPLLQPTDAPPPKVVNPSKLPPGAVYIRTPFEVEVQFGGWTGDQQMRQARYIALHHDRPSQTMPAISPLASDRPRREKDTAPASRRWTVTHAERVLYPEAGVTKGDVALYYSRVWPFIEPHLKNRPVSLLRVPESINKEMFFQRHPLKGMTKGLRTFGPRDEEYLLLEGELGLQTAVQFGVVELHGWNALYPALDLPDRMVFDLDPDETLPFRSVISGALELRNYLEAAQLQCWPLLSGGKGIHVVVPLARRNPAEDVSYFCSAFAKRLSTEHPQRFVATISKAKRKGKILIDYLRNRTKATAVLPWSLRARPEATVAAPVTWEELQNIRSPRDFTIHNLPHQDAWNGFFQCTQSIPARVLTLLRKS